MRAWADHFDGPPTVVSSAPGRVNLIGEHTDYNEGMVLPAAIDRRVVVLARPASEDEICSAQIRDSRDHRGPGWRRYAYACRDALAAKGHPAPPIQAMVSSNVPSGSGLSSSAALELAFLGAWNVIGSLGLMPEELAEVAWEAENRYVGVRCGRMDQMASALGKKDCGILFDMRTLDWEAVPLPDSLQIAILDTRQSRSLAGSKYNERVEECERALKVLNCLRPTIRSLRDATLSDLAEAVEAGLDDTAYRRARHVVTENARVVQYRDGLIALDLKALGEIADASHASLKEDYEVSSPRLDAMVRSARAAPGCISVRMTGAGFGGCCVALVETTRFGEFKAATRSSYEMYGFPTPNIFCTAACDGAAARRYP